MGPSEGRIGFFPWQEYSLDVVGGPYSLLKLKELVTQRWKVRGHQTMIPWPHPRGSVMAENMNFGVPLPGHTWNLTHTCCVTLGQLQKLSVLHGPWLLTADVPSTSWTGLRVEYVNERKWKQISVLFHPHPPHHPQPRWAESTGFVRLHLLISFPWAHLCVPGA
jgi:hypothetical protein